jgi:putative ABC transport system substrate-binding protein
VESTVWRSTVGFIVTLALGLLWASLTAKAQQARQVPRIGFLAGNRAGAEPLYAAFQHGLRELGWVEGQNIVIERRIAEEGREEQLPLLAAELVRLGVDVLVTGLGEPGIRALQHATSTIPIVMAVSADPVGAGLVASLARPGGNITGVSIMAPEGGAKRLELLKDAVPQASHVAVLWNAAFPGKDLEWQATQQAARALGVTLHAVEVRGPDEVDRALAAIARERPEALIVFSDPLTLGHQRQIVEFATQYRLPMISEIKGFAQTGGLMTYGASLPALSQRAAYYVDRILKGTKPADLPVEQPTKFEFVINLKTAAALGLTLPPHLLVFADEVIR